MSKKLTLNEKKLVSEHVTGETKRCLAILQRLGKQIISDKKDSTNEDEDWKCFEEAVINIIEDSPYIEFYPELLKRIPK